MQSQLILAAQDFKPFAMSPSLWDKTKHTIHSVAVPILIGVGAAFSAGTFFPTLSFASGAILKSFIHLSPLLANPGLYGLAALALGVVLYVKQLFVCNALVKRRNEEFRQLGFPVFGLQTPHIQRISFGTLECQFTAKELGSGSIKTVHQAYSRTHGMIAVSQLVEGENSGRFEKFHVREKVLKVWQEVAKANPSERGGLGPIIEAKIIQTPEEGRIQYLVQPYFNLPNLSSILKGKTLEVHDRLDIALDLLRALAVMHQNKLVHGDIKLDNIQLHVNGRALNAFLIDADTAYVETAQDEGVPDPKRKLLGAPISWAPEIFVSKDSDLERIDRFKTDIWALGMIFMTLFVKEPVIYQKLHKEIEKAGQKDKMREDFQKNTGITKLEKVEKTFNNWLSWAKAEMLMPQFDLLKPILVGMLQPLPSKRLTASEAFQQLEAVMKANFKRS